MKLDYISKFETPNVKFNIFYVNVKFHLGFMYETKA